MITATLQDLFKRYRRPGDIVFAILFMLFSLFLLYSLDGQVKITKRTKWFAQPSLWPTIAVYSMVFFASLHLISSLVSERIPGRLKEVIFWAKSLEYVGYFMIYVFLVPIIGYLLSTILFSLFLAVRTGFRDMISISCAIAFGVIVPFIFRAGLQVKIPAGAIYEYLPDSIRVFFMINL